MRLRRFLVVVGSPRKVIRQSVHNPEFAQSRNFFRFRACRIDSPHAFLRASARTSSSPPHRHAFNKVRKIRKRVGRQPRPRAVLSLNRTQPPARQKRVFDQLTFSDSEDHSVWAETNSRLKGVRAHFGHTVDLITAF
jgi:hypothetical protein